MASKGFDLNGRVVLITGASSGMGRAAALAFAEERARLLLAARRPEEGEVVARAIRAKGGQALFVAADVTREKDVQTVVDATVREYGRLDVAFNNAGTEGLAAPLIDPTNDNYELVMNTNVRSIFWSMQYEIRAMLVRGGGAIVNIGSGNEHTAMPGLSWYLGAKQGVYGMTKVSALDYGAQGIRVNAVGPGPMWTPALRETAATIPHHLDKHIAHIPMRRIAEPAEVAEAAVWLCSPAASYVLGHTLSVDGGYVLG